MNRACYRIVFNKKRGQRMVVAESAVGAGKGAGTTKTAGALLAQIESVKAAALSPLEVLKQAGERRRLRPCCSRQGPRRKRRFPESTHQYS